MKLKIGQDGFYHHNFEDGNFCSFGVTEAIVAGSVLAEAVGTTAATAIVAGGLGAAAGAAGSAITGGNPLTGALTGGLGGGLGALGGAAGLASGIGSTAGSALGAAAGGALGAGVTGGDPLTASLMAGGASLLNSGLNGGFSTNSPGSAAGPNAPAAVGTDANPGSLGDMQIDPATGSSTPVGGGNSTPINGALSTPTAANNYANMTPGQQVAADIAAEGSGLAPGAVNPNNPGFLSKVSNYLLGTGAPASAGNVAGTGASAAGSPGILSTIGNKVANNPLQAIMLGLNLYNQSQKPANPTLDQQQASTQGPGWNSPLPQYQPNIVRNSPTNYYTYGYSPQSAQFTNQLTPMKTGGKVKKMAVGGIAPPRIRIPHVGAATKHPSGAGIASLGAIAKLHAQQNASPAGALNALASGGRPKIHPTFMKQGQVAMNTGTGGQADKIPAMLSEDEYVIPADVTSHLGDGSSNSGGRVLDKFVQNVRRQKGAKSKGLPPKAKSPEHYMGS